MEGNSDCGSWRLVSLDLARIFALGALCLFASVCGEESAALGAGLGEGSEVGGKLAIGVIAAAIKSALLFI